MRRGFTLLELLFCALIFSSLAIITPIFSSPKFSAEKEAQKLQHYFYKFMHISKTTHTNLNISFKKKLIEISYYVNNKKITFDDGIFNADNGCRFECNIINYATYSAQWGTMSPAFTLKISGADDKEYYLKINVQGRIRILKNNDSEE